jgi:aerotolerance regulator-like protein/VWA domain-containing protein
MPFLNPWLLLLSAGAAAPVVIHLLNRHRPRTIRWGAMVLLQRVLRRRARQIRLQDLLLMLLRCLVILLLVAALARPTTRWAGPVTAADVGVVIGIDVSGSMSQRGVARSRLDLAVDRAREILATVAPGRPVTLVALGQSPRVLLWNVGYEAQRAEAALASLEPSPERLSLARGLAELVDLADQIKAPQREVFLITDAQRTDFDPLSGAALDAWRRLAAENRAFLVPVQPNGDQNAAVTDLELVSGVLRTGQMARYVARVANFGDESREIGEVHFEIDGKEIDRQYVGMLAAGQSAAVPLFAAWEEPGVRRLTARIGEDSLESDNARHAVANVREALRVLCVDGGSVRNPSGSAIWYVVKAMAPRLDLTGRSGLEIEVVSWMGLQDVDLSVYDAVLLANVPDFSEAQADRLAGYVSAGGGVMIFLGENVRVDEWNAHLHSPERLLLPGRLGQASPLLTENEDLPIDPEIPDHPAVEALRLLGGDRLANTHFRHVTPVLPDPQARVLLRLAGGGGPVLLSKPFGRGKVLLLASSADRTWNDLAVSPILPLLLRQSLTWLVRKPFEEPLRVGEPMVLRLPAEALGQDVEVRDPRGEMLSLTPMPGDGGSLLELPQTRWPGFYESRAEGADPILAVVNVDPSESDIRTVSPSALKGALGGGGGSAISPTGSIRAAVREGRVGRELWRYFMMAAVAAALLEAWLARRFTRRRAGAPAAPAEPRAPREVPA